MNSPVRYRIVPHHLGAHLFEVHCRVEQPHADGQQFWLPAWIPGSYMIRDFARHIVEIEASDADGKIAVHKLDKATWQCAPSNGPISLRYRIYAWDLSVRGAHLDQTHGFFNGTSVFLAAAGHEHAPCSVDILPPDSEVHDCSDWQVATSLPRRNADPWGFGSYQAADYDELIDHPVEMGTFSRGEFSAAGVTHHVAITGRHYCDMPRLCRDLVPICEHHIALFGAPAPVDSYLFMVMAVGDGYGGLEHRSSTALMCSRDDLPQPGEDKISDGYRKFLGLCSHEYFHTWNVKRIKPDVFVPYMLKDECYTRQLWAFEGITSYYDDLSLTRCGLIEPSSYLELLGQTITRVIRGSGRFKQSVAESSLDAWTRFYRQDENAPNAIVSYYAKGSLIALALDLTIRASSDGQRSLDDLMHLLWQRYGQTGRGVPEGEIEKLASELGGPALNGFFERFLHGTEDPDLEQLLAQLGIGYHLRVATGMSDAGGTPGSDNNSASEPVSLGLKLSAAAEQTRVTVVFDDGPAQQAGIAAGDVLLAIDGLKLTAANYTRHLARYQPGQRPLLHAFRRDELLEFRPELVAAASDSCYLVIDENSDANTTSRRNAWFGATAQR